MTTTEIAVNAAAGIEAARAAARSAIELSADQREWTPQQIAALKELGIDDAPAATLDLFFHRCRTTGLDPFNKEIYLIGRKTKVGGYRGEPERWETKWTTQTGIDGFRKNGKKSAAREGHKVRTEGPFWKGENGGDWSEDALFGRDEHGRRVLPGVAKFIIWVDGEPFPGIAHYDEFVQTSGRGDSERPNSMWAKMPANQLAKCAEAQAWRKAYPEDFSGLALEDAAQVIDPDGTPVQATAERVHRSATAVLTAIEGADVVPAEEPAAEVSPVEESAASRAQLDRVAALFEEVGLTKRADKYEYLSLKLDRKITGANQLTEAEADQIICALTEANSGPPADATDQPADEIAGGAQ